MSTLKFTWRAFKMVTLTALALGFAYSVGVQMAGLG